jgi:putative nucleotidyltransferase with HDIG domain
MVRGRGRDDSVEDPYKIAVIKRVDVDDPGLKREFIPIEIQDISAQDLLPFSIYFPFLTNKETINLKKIATSGGFLNSRWKTLFQENSINHAYVHVNEFDRYVSYINNRFKKALANVYLNAEKKNEIIYRNASYVMNRILSDPRSGRNIHMGIDMVNMLSSYIVKNEITASMLAKLFSKNYELFSHSLQVALLTMVFCRFLKSDANSIFYGGLGALLHDIGKVDLPREILLKKAKLTEDEFALMKQHPELGVKILRQHSSISEEVLEIVYQHHENADGSGYPCGLTIGEISPLGQIVRIVDCYDALTTNRFYKNALRPFEALKEMVMEMKHAFDLKLLELFVIFLGY